jgi:tetratricopeptide (TPR) repeat protein
MPPRRALPFLAAVVALPRASSPRCPAPPSRRWPLSRVVLGCSGVLAALALVAGCAGPSRQFLEAKAAGDRAKTSGRYEEAARAYHDAAATAKRDRDRDEGLFLEAETYRQAGRSREAMSALDALIAASPNGERTERAIFDRAFLEIEHGDQAAGWAALEKATFEHPRAGSARRALRKVAEHKEAEQKGGGRAFLEQAAQRLASDELGEDAMYLYAHALRDEGRAREARDAFVLCAQRHPYPSGSLNDNAWYNAAELDLELGEPLVAIEHLRALLAPREIATLKQGSYERPLYAPAQLKIAEIYRDQLGDAARAREEFHRLYTAHTTSPLRDDALWSEAMLARKSGDERGVCSVASDLVKDFPESRFSACASLLCPSVKPPEKAIACRGYLKTQLGGG